MLNLNFSKLVNIGLYTFNIDELTYEHDLFIIEDAVINSKYYLIDVARNITKRNVLECRKNDVLLESLSICELSIKKDIPYQIALFLNKLGFIENVSFVADVLENINISFFEVRYNFYKNGRFEDMGDVQDVVDILCTFFKVKKILKDGSFGAIVEDIDLFNLKKMIYSVV